MERKSRISRKSHKPSRRRLRLKQRLKFMRRFRRRPKVWREVLLGMSVIVVFLALVGGIVWWIVQLGKSPLDEIAANSAAPPEIVQPIEEPRLIGAWQRDGDASIAEMQKDGPLPNDLALAFRKSFLTKMTIKYTATTMTIESGGIVDQQPYKIISKNDNGLVFTVWFDATKSTEEVKIRFLGDDLYRSDIEIVNGDNKSVSTECYRRIR